MATSASENEFVGENIEVVQFKLGDSNYAIRVSDANSIIKPKKTTRVPRSVASVEGVMDYRGEVAVVIDMYSILGIEQSKEIDELKERLIILDDAVDNQTVGIHVDSILGVQIYPESQLQTEVEATGHTDIDDFELIEGVFTVKDDNEETVAVELVDIKAVLQQIREESRIEFQQTK